MGRAAAGRHSQSLVLTGLGGVGKTVLLNEMADRAWHRDWIVAEVEASSNPDARSSAFRSMLTRSLNLALRQVSASDGVGGALEAALATFKSFSIRTDPSARLSLGIDVDPQKGRADSGSLAMDLSELAFDLGAYASDRGTGVVVLIDEMQELSAEDLAALCTAVHAAGQRRMPFYVVGAGLPSLVGLLGEARPYAERLFECRLIGPLGEPDAQLAVSRPAALQDVSWTAGAIASVVSASMGYPFLLQEFAKATWDFAPGPAVIEADAALGVQLGWEKLDSGFFASRWERAAAGERNYLRAMVEDGDSPSATGEVARRLGKKRVQQVGPIRARLIHKGLIYPPERGFVAFTVLGMADFINRQLN